MAFAGPLPVGARGMEFVTAIIPRYKQPFPGGLVKWYEGDPGVVSVASPGNGLACIPVTITLVNQ